MTAVVAQRAGVLTRVLLVLLIACGTTPAPAPVISGSAPPAPAPAPTPTPPPEPDANTGFDLYVTPSNVTDWKLDGEVRTDRLPSRIRGLSPGKHTLEIDPPDGYLPYRVELAIVLGKSEKLDIALQHR
jgi:hypothetical protein